ncbi:MAG: HIT domain-containing protein [Nanoarchaeota archaeon]
MKCAFCELPEIKERTIISLEHAFAFPTNIPIVPGHVLVCPKRCVATVEELKADEIVDVFDILFRMKKAMHKTFGAEGYNYAWNEGKLAGQSVPHFQMHILPRKEGDTGITQYEPREFLYRPGSREPSPERELKSIADLIRQNL